MSYLHFLAMGSDPMEDTVYNVAAQLPRAVASVVAQTHHKWELVSVDDGSSDGFAMGSDPIAGAGIRRSV